MQTLAEMLTHQPQPVQPVVSRRTAYNPTAVAASLQRNADKPCTRCGHPKRHKSRTGRMNTTMCTTCYQQHQAIYRKGIRQY